MRSVRGSRRPYGHALKGRGVLSLSLGKTPDGTRTVPSPANLILLLGRSWTLFWLLGIIFYQYRADRARRTLKGIDQQIAKAEKAVAGQAAIKRNRFVQLTGATKTINRGLETKARALAGLKGYVTNLPDPTSEFVMGAYHQLWRIEKSFRMSKTDLRARPIDHHTRDSIEAHLTIVMRSRRQPLAGTPDRLADQETRHHTVPPPQHCCPARRPHPPRRNTPRQRHPSRSQHRQERSPWSLN